MKKIYLPAISLLTLVVAALALVAPVASYVRIQVSGKIYIDDPRYSSPAIKLAGEELNITIYTAGENFTVKEVDLIAPNLSYSTSGGGVLISGKGSIGTNYVYVTVKLSSHMKPELYDVIVKGEASGEEVKLLSPRSIWVLGKWPSVIRVLHVTDTHIGLFLDGMSSSERYETYITLANALPNVDVVFCTGDCVDVGSDTLSLKDFYYITNQLRKPSFIVPGNHDHAQVGTLAGFLHAYYGRYIGKPYWVRSFGNYTIIGLDTGSEGYLDTAQLSWLKEVLDRYANKTTIILLHHPIFNYPGEYVGTYGNINSLMSKFYSSWREHFNSLKQFMKLIDEHPGVVAVFAGHIHRDAVAMYNNRVWFITTTTACGGRPYYRGFRVVYIYANGTVEVKAPEGRNVFSDTSSFNAEPADGTTVYYNENMTVYIHRINVSDGFELELRSVPLYFYVNASIPATAYKLYGDVRLVKNYTIARYGEYLVYRVLVDVVPGSDFKIILASFNDTAPPKVSIGLISPSKPIAGRHQVLVTIKASDQGWGLSCVKLLYKAEGESTWHEINALHTGPDQYQAIIPALNTTSITIKAIAEDWAGYKAESTERKINYVYIKTATSPTASTTLTTTSPATTATTSPITTTTSPSPTTTAPTTTTPTTTPTTTAATPTTITTLLTSTSPTTSYTTQPSPAPPGVPSLGLIAGVAIVILIVIIAITYAVKRK